MPLDPMTARLKCLRLVLNHQASEFTAAGPVVEQAEIMAKFVIGEPIKSSSSFGKAGADDPKKPGAA